jgi:hypothetical protein
VQTDAGSKGTGANALIREHVKSVAAPSYLAAGWSWGSPSCVEDADCDKGALRLEKSGRAVESKGAISESAATCRVSIPDHRLSELAQRLGTDSYQARAPTGPGAGAVD